MIPPLALPSPGDPAAVPPGTGQPSAGGAAAKYDRSYMLLTPDQEERLRDYLRKRIMECRKDMGLDYLGYRPAGLSMSAVGLGSSAYSSGFTTLVDS